MERGVRILLAAYAVLGAAALWFGLYAGPGHEPVLFLYWKPTVMYWTLSAIMLVAPLFGWGYPVKAVFGTYFVFTSKEWRWINLCFALACAALGTLNLVIVFAHTKDDWEGFKFSCMVNVAAVFLMRLAFVWVDAAARIVSDLYRRAKAHVP